MANPKREARVNAPTIKYYIFQGSRPSLIDVLLETTERKVKGLPSDIHYHKDWEPCVAKCKVVEP